MLIATRRFPPPVKGRIAVGSGRAAHRAAWNLSCVFLFPFLAPTLTLSLALGYEICNPNLTSSACTHTKTDFESGHVTTPTF